ncbi:hypothetical protein BT096_02445 [Corynebacterium diphtheriae]|nr:hypothetical protein [Corynebacterium diphtheriae]PSA81001.1 hypothetical protein BT096_02445 [Corynebacterium diphtheriae]
MAGIGGALVGAPPPLTPEKTALHTKSAQTAGLEAIWCEAWARRCLLESGLGLNQGRRRQAL